MDSPTELSYGILYWSVSFYFTKAGTEVIRLNVFVSVYSPVSSLTERGLAF